MQVHVNARDDSHNLVVQKHTKQDLKQRRTFKCQEQLNERWRHKFVEGNCVREQTKKLSINDFIKRMQEMTEGGAKKETQKSDSTQG